MSTKKLQEGEYGPLRRCVELEANGKPLIPATKMSLRDWFAGQAMMGMLAAGEVAGQPKNDAQLSAWAYKTADAMLAAREVKP